VCFVFLYRTNLPAKIMNFPDYITMEGREPSCVSHQEVLNYLKDYAQHFDVHRHIQVISLYFRIKNMKEN